MNNKNNDVDISKAESTEKKPGFWDKYKNNFSNFFNNKRKRHGTVATCITVGIIILSILLNIGISALDTKFNLSADLTKNKFFKLTDQSINYIKNLDKDIEIIVLGDETEFSSQGDYFVQANSVIKNYGQNSDKINVRYVDLTQTPTFVNDYPSESLNTNSIIVKCDSKYKVLTPEDLFNIQSVYYQSYITSSEAEQAMTSAIMYVTSENLSKVCFITGYAEEDPSSFSSLLKKNNYDVSNLDITTEEISSDYDMVIIHGPARDYDSEGIAKLDKYLDNNGQFGKNIMVILSPDQKENATLSAFLEKWNIKIGDGLVFESDPKLLLSTNTPYYAKHEYVDETFSKNISNQSIPVSIPFAKPLEVLNEASGVKTLLQSSSTSGIVPSSADENWAPSETDMKGAIPSMLLSSKTNDSNSTSNVAVVSSVVAFSEQLLSRTALNNSAYFINAVNIIIDRDSANSITIESKAAGGNELGIQPFQAIGLGIVLTIVLPLGLLITGLVIWLRRRHL